MQLGASEWVDCGHLHVQNLHCTSVVAAMRQGGGVYQIFVLFSVALLHTPQISKPNIIYRVWPPLDISSSIFSPPLGKT